MEATVAGAFVTNKAQPPSKAGLSWTDLMTAGICCRLVLSALSRGTDDAMIWQSFGASIASTGLLHLYRADGSFNHPPLPAYWAMLAFLLTRYIAVGFPFIFRLPGIVADMLSCWILCRISARRAPGPGAVRKGAMSGAAFAWSPCAILMAGHHGSTDSIYAALCLLSAYCAAELASPFAAGLALGAAINVKLIPVLLIVPFLLLFRSRFAAAKFIGGLAIMAIPFIPVLIGCGAAFYRNAIEYNSVVDYWGIDQILLEAQTVKKYAGVGTVLLAQYQSEGRYVVLASVLAFAILARRRRLDFYTTGACVAALFLILTPGFGVQYLIFVLPLLFAADMRMGIKFGLLAGAFMFIAYDLFWDGTLPIRTLSIAVRVRRGPGELLAVLAWATLINFVYRTVRRPS